MSTSPAVRRVSELLLTAVLVTSPTLAQSPSAATVPVLIVDGQNNHDWQTTTASLGATLRKTGRFQVDVSTTPPKGAGADDWRRWRPDFAKYRAVVLNYNGETWPAEVQGAFTDYVSGGGGVVAVHAANNPFPDWPEFNRMIGLGWRKAEYGEGITIEDATGRQVRRAAGQGPHAGHGPSHRFAIKVRAPEHPIMKGLPPAWLHGEDQLSHGQRGPAQGMTVLDSAYADPGRGGTGEHEPMTWVIPFGKGQVVTTMLGHQWKDQRHREALECVGFQTVLARSVEWVATGRVTLPAPASFPSLDRVSLAAPTAAANGPLPPGVAVRGWTILSASEADARATIAKAPAYGINHLELSHLLVHDLREIKDDARRDLVNRLTDAAHAAGISEVVLWDHALYKLDYYPAEFRTGPGGTLDLDNPAFWEWLKGDYRAMLDRVPRADGIVLTFIETGARAERQHSQKLKTNQQKLAAVVNAVADVVIGERKLNLYARTFSYTHAEYANVIGAVELFARPEIRLMMKETPHDFFLTHPNDRYAGTIPRPTLMEFDAAGEFHGQGIVANTWPEYMLRRWRDFARRPHVIGYTARADRYGDTRLVGRPEEINLLALQRGAEDPEVTAEQVYDEFIAARYGARALPEVKAAFKKAFDITASVLYTLGTNVANHSQLNYDPSASSYVLHVSGKWLDPPVAWVGHGVDRELHYWKDVVDHLAPPFVKVPGNRQWDEVRWVWERGWIHPGEAMDEEYLRLILIEKDHGVTLAQAAVGHVENARPFLEPAAYEQLHHHFQHTLLTARLHRATSAAYFGFRAWSRGGDHRTPFVRETVQGGLAGIQELIPLIRAYPVKPPTGQWDWTKDADQAERYFNLIVRDGWPAETRDVPNPNAGMKFPYEGH